MQNPRHRTVAGICNFGIRFLLHLCAQEVGPSTVIVLCVRLPGDKNSLLCLLNSCLNILGVRKCFFYHCGAMPAVQQLIALPCLNGASCPLLFQLKTKSARSIGFILVFQSLWHICVFYCELFSYPVVILYML